MILSYMYLIRTGHQTARAKQGAAKAAKHHYKRAKGARGQGGSTEGGGLFKAIASGRGGGKGPGRRGRGQAEGAGRSAPGAGRGLPLVGALCA